jgi:hypothetical protein
MEFLKKHYEKILLGVMLAGLIGVLVFMLFYIAADKQAMDQQANEVLYPQVKALTNLDLTLQDTAMMRHQSAYALDFEHTNKLFNPMEWQKTPDGRMLKIGTGSEVGIRAAVVTGITPLYLVLTLDQITTNEFGVRYTIGVEKQAASSAVKRKKTPRFISPDEKKPNDIFSLVEVKGAPDAPEAVVVKLVDSGDVAVILRDKPWRRVDAYAADFRYVPENKIFRGRRVGDKASFGGTDYLVVDVSQNELILSDQSNQKKNSLPFAP